MLLRVIDAGSFAGDATWPTRLIALFVTLAGIFIAGSLIGLISSAVDQRIDALGRSRVLERGHTLILGWSARVPTIVSELVIANESEKRAAIVILAELDKTEVEETIRTTVPDLRTTRVVARRGDPTRMADLELVGIADARSVVVMSGAEGDAGAIKTSLAVLGFELADVPIIVEMQSAAQADTLEAVTDEGVVTVNSDRVIAEVTAQACRERGLSAVFRELLDFDGDELYFREFPQLVGSTYAQAQQSFERAAVIGVGTVDGPILNPPPDRPIGSEESLLALVEDDSVFTLDRIAPMRDVAAATRIDDAPPQRVLMVGWSNLAPRVLKELDEFLPAGSRVDVIVDPEFVDPEAARGQHRTVNATVEIQSFSGGPERLGDLLGDTDYAQAVLLGYREGISADDADARTLLTLMALRMRWPKGQPPDIRLVAEVLDERNVPIAELADVDDFIVSEQLAGLMLAQLSENVELRGVFDELFDAEGASLAMRPARRFSSNGSATFGDIVAAGNRYRESVLGYRKARSGEVVLNPGLSAVVPLEPDDEVIVVTTR
ncbi:MAG: hypothetical protein M3290_06055 [Actinomycetota bacterium]|nr:hypothetical protein [Actinomycetota bacterium]